MKITPIPLPLHQFPLLLRERRLFEKKKNQINEVVFLNLTMVIKSKFQMSEELCAILGRELRRIREEC